MPCSAIRKAASSVSAVKRTVTRGDPLTTAMSDASTVVKSAMAWVRVGRTSSGRTPSSRVPTIMMTR
jgi:hypothetical protein